MGLGAHEEGPEPGGQMALCCEFLFFWKICPQSVAGHFFVKPAGFAPFSVPTAVTVAVFLLSHLTGVSTGVFRRHGCV
jgi:hypothetical protein